VQEDHDLAADREQLLALALSRPREALERARTVLGSQPGPLQACVARQAIGIVLREFGDIDAAVRELRTARALARRARSVQREADVLATLGVALVFAGRTALGLRSLDTAVGQSSGRLNGRIRLRRGGVLVVLGRHDEALADLNAAVATLRLAGDPVWQARALTERAFAVLALGSVRPAAADLRQAEALFTAAGQELESADAVVHRGLLALRVGDLPAALTAFDEAAARFDRLGATDPTLSMHRCEGLLSAGLPADALAEADAAIERQRSIRGQSTKLAELLLVGARCALSAGDPALALSRSGQATELFRRQHRQWWYVHARLGRVQAASVAGPATASLLRDARRCVRELADVGSPQLPLARLVAGRIALALGRGAEAERQLAAAAGARRRGPALARAVGWQAEALRARAAGDPARLMAAARRGLAVIEEHRAVLGSSELRAQATSHGAELALLGQRRALSLDRPRLLLSWSERWRSVALAVPAARAPDDEQLQSDLAALRAVSGRLARAPVRGSSTAALQREQQRLERAVRSSALRTRHPAADPAANGRGRVRRSTDLVAAVLDQLADGRLVELVDVDGQLQVLVCGSGTIRRFSAGRTDAVQRELGFARFALNRLAHGRSRMPPDQLLERLEREGGTLERLLLGEARGQLGDGPVVVVPPGRLQAVPWALLPSLRRCALSVAPSAASWLSADRARASDRASLAQHHPAGRVVLARGPRLASGGAEVLQVAEEYSAERAAGGRSGAAGGRSGAAGGRSGAAGGRSGAAGRRSGTDSPQAGGELVVLGDGTATVASVLQCIDGADLAHIAAHGVFRADSPLFSSLSLDDGPLTVYDLERLRRGPRNLVLSSCDSGLLAPAGADEVLGLAGCLIPLGTTGIVASVLPVNDAAAVPLMIALHRELRTGADLADALCRARRGAADVLAVATGWSFVCLGAG
jgi:tetratricopeptide (TPR) repeat protein